MCDLHPVHIQYIHIILSVLWCIFYIFHIKGETVCFINRIQLNFSIFSIYSISIDIKVGNGNFVTIDVDMKNIRVWPWVSRVTAWMDWMGGGECCSVECRVGARTLVNCIWVTSSHKFIFMCGYLYDPHSTSKLHTQQTTKENIFRYINIDIIYFYAIPTKHKDNVLSSIRLLQRT